MVSGSITPRRLAPQKEEAGGTCALWVVFSDDTDIGFLKMLKRGFRHCFVLIRQDRTWILVDPRADMTEITILPHPAHFNLPRYFTETGKTVCRVPATMNAPRRIAPLVPWSCVESVKRVIGLHARFTLTPYQLYRTLTRTKKG